MAFINRVCDKVFVINLEKDKERLQDFDSNMKKNHIIYQKYNAVLGSKVLKDDRLTDFCNTYCTDGAKGCALSHRNIWEMMIKNNYSNVLIFEDDAIIDENFDREFNNVWNHLPDEYDIVYFGAILGGVDDSVSNSIFKKIFGIKSEDINEYVQTTKGTAGTHCYMLSLEGAKKFIDKKINFSIDIQILSWIKEYNYTAYLSNPNMVETSQDNSSISDTYPYLLNMILRKFTFNNLKKPSTLDWAFGENLITFCGFNINWLLIMLFFIIILVPIQLYPYIYLWLLIEFLYSFDFKNTFRFASILSIPIFLKYLLTTK